MWRIVFAAVLALCFTLATFEAVAERLDVKRLSQRGTLITVRGRKMHIDCRGTSGPSVIFEAGAGSTSLSWSRIHDQVAAFSRACAYDRAGLGWSERSTRPRTIGRMSDELRDLLRAAGVKPPYVLVAHSLGGAIAIDYASAHPEEVAGFVFVDAAYRELYEEYIERFPTWWSRTQRSKWMLRAAYATAYIGLPRLARIPIGSRELSARDRAAANARGWRPVFFKTMIDEINGLATSLDEAPSNRTPDVPAAVLSHDDPDAIFNDKEAEALWQELESQLAGRFSHSTRVVVKGSGHFIQLDQPDAVTSAVREVVAQVKQER